MKKCRIYGLLCVVLLFVACEGKKITRTDTTTSGTAQIASDECFAPIVTEELAVFTGLNTDAHITPVFVGEADLFKFLLTDSIRAIIAARDLTEAEKARIKELKRTPRSQRVAIDGIALIINKNNNDSLISVATLNKIMSGEITDWNQVTLSGNKTSLPIQVVFDNPYSSTVRFIRDSICKGKPMSNQLSAVQSNAAVIDYVEKHANALGVIGVNWVSNPYDSLKLSFDEKIRVMAVSRNNIPTWEDSYHPVPAYLATRQYPLVRDIYAIISDVREGLPAGFVAFLAGESGQRIIYKAGLVPANTPMRLVDIKDEF